MTFMGIAFVQALFLYPCKGVAVELQGFITCHVVSCCNWDRFLDLLLHSTCAMVDLETMRYLHGINVSEFLSVMGVK